jgi:hypothetical protein
MNKTVRNYLTAAFIPVIISGFASGNASAGGVLDVDFFDDVTFSAPIGVDNPYWPLNPDGKSRIFTYEAEGEDGCVVNKIYVDGGPPGGPTTGVKMLTGDYAFLGQVLEVLDIEWVDEECDGNLVETEITFDWYAQDDFKNIWYMGEASRDFGDVEIDGEEVPCPTLEQVPLGTPEDDWEDFGFGGDFFTECTAGSWEAGIEGGEGEDAVIGEPGIVVPSDMPLGPGSEPLGNGTYYMQEVAFEAQDMAKILRQGAALSVEDGVDPGEYDNCRKVKEWNPFEHGGSVEHKWYCHDQGEDYGPGLVLIEGVGGGRTEVETLVEINPAY